MVVYTSIWLSTCWFDLICWGTLLVNNSVIRKSFWFYSFCCLVFWCRVDPKKMHEMAIGKVCYHFFVVIIALMMVSTVCLGDTSCISEQPSRWTIVHTGLQGSRCYTVIWTFLLWEGRGNTMLTTVESRTINELAVKKKLLHLIFRFSI